MQDCNRVSGAGVAHLKKLTKLKEFKAWGNLIDDAAFETIKGFVNLKTLGLDDG